MTLKPLNTVYRVVNGGYIDSETISRPEVVNHRPRRRGFHEGQ